MVTLLTGLALIFCLLWPTTARADLGQVRHSQTAGPYLVTVLTSPTPLSAGPVEISVFVQQADTLEPVEDATVDIALIPLDNQQQSRVRATHDRNATGPHYVVRSIFTHAGPWKIEIQVASSAEQATVSFECEVAPTPPRWQTLWPWISWPPAVILLFAMREYTRYRQQKPTVSSHTNQSEGTSP